ncbi:exostosin family protein [Artemisia annua]|uniref:Exostosin family protein n=1 Tax=Artemisia annua TaxID=35608 RepID=A0A2U1PD30_ARTAN|nr:exostosin family protein [Artemisia annua]
MEKGNFMFQQSSIYAFGLVCALTYVVLLYIHFNVSVSVNESTKSNPFGFTDREIAEAKAAILRLENPKNDKVFPFSKALKSAENKSDPCGGRYVYIHKLPSRFNEDIVKECGSVNKWLNMCKSEYVMNNGFGALLNDTEGVFSDHGWYDTNDQNLETIFFTRMKRYECLTNDSSIAAATFVPFYAGFDVARYMFGFNVSVRDAASIEVVEWLQKRDEWKYMNGKDHFLVAGRPTWDFRRPSDEESKWGNKFLLLPAVKNMSLLTTESNPFSANDFAIPYPTYFHPSYDNEVLDWQDRMMKMERKWLFCFTGAPRPGNPKSIRSLLIDQCKNSGVGKLLDCGVGDKNCHSPSSVMKMFQSSVFCLQPKGDSATRRSAFDSIFAGCIPVFFHPSSFYVQYTWHLPKNYTKYSVFIPEDDVRKNISIEQRLSQIDSKRIKMMQKEIISMIPRLIYVDPYSKLETIEDAFDVALKAIINKVRKLREDIVDGETNDEFDEKLSWKYALQEQGDFEAVREWDPYYSETKSMNGDVDPINHNTSKLDQLQGR